MELPEGFPTPIVHAFQNLCSCFVPPRLEPLNVVFSKEFYHAHQPIEHALVYSFPIDAHVSRQLCNHSVHSFRQRSQLLFKIRVFSNEMSKFPIGAELPVTTW